MINAPKYMSNLNIDTIFGSTLTKSTHYEVITLTYEVSIEISVHEMINV